MKINNEQITKTNEFVNGKQVYVCPYIISLDNGTVYDYEKTFEADPIPGIDYAWLDLSNSYIYKYQDNNEYIYPLPYVSYNTSFKYTYFSIDHGGLNIRMWNKGANWNGYRAYIVMKFIS